MQPKAADTTTAEQTVARLNTTRFIANSHKVKRLMAVDAAGARRPTTAHRVAIQPAYLSGSINSRPSAFVLAVALIIACIGLGSTIRPVAAQNSTQDAGVTTKDSADDTAGDSDGSTEPYTESLSGTTVSFEMVPVPAGVMADSAGNPIQTPGFWISQTEITWDVYDVYVFALDGKSGPEAADAVAKPSKPYVLPGDDFGHAGMPALGMTARAADQFVAWLSAKTGNPYRILSESEWEYACRTSIGAVDAVEAAAGKVNIEKLDAVAWHRGNSDGGTKPVGSGDGGPLGVHDMLGNAAEWVHGNDGEPVVKGGSYLDRPTRIGCDAKRTYNKSWQMTDPQIPKSPWWLSDGPFVTLRVARSFDTE